MLLINILILLQLINCYKYNYYNRSLAINYINNNCPASSVINTKYDGLYAYPLDVFPSIDDNVTIQHSNISYYKCRAADEWADKHKNHICNDNEFMNLCPIYNEDVYTFMNRSTSYNYKHSFCQLKNTFYNESSTSTVIIFGGSVTKGGSTDGCCCDGNLESKCSNVIYSDYSNNCKGDNLYCRWSGYLTNWFNKKSKGKVTVHNLAKAGTTSPSSADWFEDMLDKINITSLNNTFTIFIDHSVNDAINHYTKQISLLHGLEQLILKIYKYSNNNQSLPSIVLLAHYPNPFSRRFIPKNFDLSIQSDIMINDYIKTYSRLANHYDILLWSYKDVIWSYNVNHKFDNITKEYLRFQHNLINSGLHPPWFIHLYYTDLIANALTYEMEHCELHDYISTNTVFELPVPLFKEHYSNCNNSYDPVVDISSEDNYKKGLFHNFYSEPNNTWVLYEDRREKYGYISEFPWNLTITNTSIISISTKYTHILTFPFTIKDNSFSSHSQIIRIYYLATYLNAGIVDVYICDEYLTTIDSLWVDYAEHKSTNIEMYSYVYKPNHKKETHTFCNNKSNGKIDFYHKSSLHTIDSSNYKLFEAKGNEKFKLISIKFCQI